MNSGRRIYLTLAIVFVASSGFLWLVWDKGALITAIAALPLVSILIGAIFKVFQDEAAYQRSLMAADRQNRFVLGASSHMANVAFDKHVLFCEEYVGEVQAALNSVFREGPSNVAWSHSAKLMQIRAKYVVWLTQEIEASLEPVETALRQMGNSAEIVGKSTEPQSARVRTEHVNRKYLLLAELCGEKEWEGKALDGERAIESQIRHLRKILGTEELSKLRQQIVVKTTADLTSN